MGEQIGLNFLNNPYYSRNAKLLEFLFDVIEENVLINLINKFIDEDADYLKAKKEKLDG